jgi:CubicO group peptidase (beta-lactamase class C family)
VTKPPCDCSTPSHQVRCASHSLRAIGARLLALALCLTATTGTLSAQEGFAEIDAAIDDGVTQRIFPGAVVVIGRADTILYAKGYGGYTWDRDTRRPDPTWSLWDIASLSKVVATASAVAVLVDSGRLALDAPVGAFLPAFRGVGKDRVTVRMLLDHTSGLPAWVPLRNTPPTIAGAQAKLFETELRRTPGEVSVYSDLNAILAAMIVEEVTGEPLDQYTTAAVFAPTGMGGAEWRPAPADRLRAVPSERLADGSARTGRVHDPNARLLGGVAGHAGVFATGIDMAHFAQSWLKGLSGERNTWVSSPTLRRFLERSDVSGTRALGWDTPRRDIDDGGPSLYGRCTTMSTYGHTGFTGTMLWFDTEQDLFVVLLTNRSYAPMRGSLDAIREVRARVSDAARRLAGERCAT